MQHSFKYWITSRGIFFLFFILCLSSVNAQKPIVIKVLENALKPRLSPSAITGYSVPKLLDAGNAYMSNNGFAALYSSSFIRYNVNPVLLSKDDQLSLPYYQKPQMQSIKKSEDNKKDISPQITPQSIEKLVNEWKKLRKAQTIEMMLKINIKIDIKNEIIKVPDKITLIIYIYGEEKYSYAA